MDYSLDKDGSYLVGFEPRPWRRFWARHIDVYFYALLTKLCTLVIPILIFTFFREIYRFRLPLQQLPPWLVGTIEILLWLIPITVWMFLEAYTLSRFGTTLGKALLEIKVRNRDNSFLSYKKALKRSLKVLLCGTGFYTFSWITYWISYHHLTSTGITYWDESEDLEVTTYPVNQKKVVFAVIFIGATILLLH